MTGELLDRVHRTKDYSVAVDEQLQKLQDPGLTPSARMLAALQETGQEYTEWILHKSREHKEFFLGLTPDPAILQDLAGTAEESRRKQLQLEAGDTLNFDQFLAAYLAE